MYNPIIDEEKLNGLSLADLSALITYLEGVQHALLELDCAVNQSLLAGDKKHREQHQAKLAFLEHVLEVCWERRSALVAEVVQLKTPDGEDAFQVCLSDYQAPFA